MAFGMYMYSGYVPLRDAVFAGLGYARALVLCYHRIGARDVMSKPIHEFRRDLEHLSRKYDCVTLADLYRKLEKGEPMRRPTAVVTFDDGYRDNYTHGVPVLEAVGVPATFFVSTGFIGADRVFPHDAGGEGSAETDRYPNLSWDDLRVMQEAGFEIGSHTVDHVDLGRAEGPALEREVKQSLAELNGRLGTRSRAFAFPWGQPRNISPDALMAVRQAGYYTAVTMYGGGNARKTDPSVIHRTDAGNGEVGWLAWRARMAGLDPGRCRRRNAI
jgi:peptidoglycan/xylan/chitin deacetylase (PgdA/CDA1 family)